MAFWLKYRKASSWLVLCLVTVTGCRKEQKNSDEGNAVEPAPPDVYPAPLPPDSGFFAITKVREAAARARSSNNLKQIGLALMNYESAMGTLPPIGFSQDMMQPLLSWRVALLPYIEEGQLFNEFHLNEPWDSPHNKQLIPRMPKTYQLPARDTVPGVCYYRILVGDPKKIPPESMPIFDKPIPGSAIPQPRISIGNILDGTSNTIMAFEAGEGIVWTKPEEMEYHPKQKIPPFGFIYGNRCNVLMGDCFVRGIGRDISESTLRAAITRAGGEILGSDW